MIEDQPAPPVAQRPRRRYPRPIRAVLDLLRDLGLALLTIVLGLAALVLPRRLHRPFVRGCAALGALTGDGSHRRLVVEQSFCRGYGVFRRGWPADVRVTGLDGFLAAHDEGHGVVLWLMGFLDQTPLTLSLADAGHPVTFLWAEHHGVYSSRAPSRRLAAPILTRGAIRPLAGAVTIPENGNKSYVRRLCSILESEHGTVGMKGDVADQSGGVGAAYRGHTVSFPSGPASLAHMTGAPLITGAVVRRDTLDHEVVIDEPITASRDLPQPQFVQAAIHEFARRLEQRVATHPDSRPRTKFDKVPPEVIDR